MFIFTFRTIQLCTSCIFDFYSVLLHTSIVCFIHLQVGILLHKKSKRVRGFSLHTVGINKKKVLSVTPGKYLTSKGRYKKYLMANSMLNMCWYFLFICVIGLGFLECFCVRMFVERIETDRRPHELRML